MNKVFDGSDFIVDIDEAYSDECFLVRYADGSEQIKPIGWVEIFRKKMEDQFTSKLILETEENMIRKSILGFCKSLAISLGSLMGIIYSCNLSLESNNKLIIVGSILAVNVAWWLKYLNSLANYGQIFCMMQCVEYFKQHKDNFLFNYIENMGTSNSQKYQMRALNIEDIYQGQFVVNDLKIMEELIKENTDEDITRMINEKLGEDGELTKKIKH